jgi:hypothetical protein
LEWPVMGKLVDGQNVPRWRTLARRHRQTAYDGGWEVEEDGIEKQT